MSASRDQRRAIVALSVLIALLAIALTGVANRVWLQDQWTVWHYQPDARVQQMVLETRMTDEGRFLFYASSPQITESEEFNETCRSGGELDAEVSILGCYTLEGITLYNVTDERLDGMIEVTAAHELLHAVWHRLDDSERDRLEVLLEAQYEQFGDDEELLTTMDWYERAEPGQHYNELHSIFGTEYAELSAELEAHYARYFQDRAAVVALYQGYQAVFSALIQERDALLAQLDELGDTHARRQSDYERELRSYETAVAGFNRRAEQPGGFATQGEFERERGRLLQREQALEAERTALNSMQQRYQELVERVNELSASAGELSSSIDSYSGR